MSTPRRINILAMAFSNLRGVFSYDSSAGSSVAGNLSDNAPWSLPADVFASSTSSPDFSASFNITGYNISANAPSPQSVPGWKLTAAVKNDVSLSTSTNSSVDKSSVFEATTLFIQAPADMTMDTSWRMCAVVYPGVNGVNSNSTTVDGSCNGVLDSGCLQALNIAGTSGPNGMDGAGNCGSFVLPAGCEGSISGTNMTAFDINQTVFDNRRFYAYGSRPVNSDNVTAHDEAKQNVWPIILMYGHLSSSGELSSRNAGIQCIRAINSTTGGDISGAVRLLHADTATYIMVAGLIITWILIK